MIPPTSFVLVESLIVNEALQLVQVPSLTAPNSSEVSLSGFLQEPPVCPSCPSFRVLHDREAMGGGSGLSRSWQRRPVFGSQLGRSVVGEGMSRRRYFASW